MFEFEEIINRLIVELNIKNKTELSNLMGVSTQTMGNWKSRNKIPYEEIVTICVNYNLDIKQIVTGKKETIQTKRVNYREELHKIIEESEEKNLETYYHLLKTEIARTNK